MRRQACSAAPLRHKGHQGHEERNRRRSCVLSVLCVESAVESAMSYSREEVKAITDKVLNMAKADGVEVRFSGGERSATRYANSTITANLVEHDQEVLITVYYGQKSASDLDASVRRCVAEVGDRAGAGAGEAAAGQSGVDAAGEAAAGLSAGRSARCSRRSNFGPAERARMVKQSVDICEKKGVVGAGYIPKLHWTDALANSEGLFAYYRYAEAQLHPDLPHARRHRLGLGRHDRAQGHLEDRRRGDHRDRRRQGAEVAQAEGARAGQLHRDPGAAAGGPLPVVDAVLAERAPGRGGPQLHERHGARRDQARSEGVRRQRHDPQRRRQRHPAPDAGRPGRLAPVRSPGSKRASSRTCSTTATGRTSRDKPFTPTSPNQSLVMDGGDADDRADDQVHQARPAGHRSSGTSGRSSR